MTAQQPELNKPQAGVLRLGINFLHHLHTLTPPFMHLLPFVNLERNLSPQPLLSLWLFLLALSYM